MNLAPSGAIYSGILTTTGKRSLHNRRGYSEARAVFIGRFSHVDAEYTEKKGLSRAESAKKAGLYQTYIGLLEHFLKTSNMDIAEKNAVELEAPSEELLNEAALNRPN